MKKYAVSILFKNINGEEILDILIIETEGTAHTEALKMPESTDLIFKGYYVANWNSTEIK